MKKLWAIIQQNAKWMVVIFFVVNIAAYLYIRYTKDVYESSSELKLDIKTEASAIGLGRMIEDERMNVVSGEIEIIESNLFLRRVLESGNFELSFYSVGRVLNNELFFSAPAIVTQYNKDHSLYDVPIHFEEISPREFRIRADASNEVIGQYGKTVTVGDLDLVIDRNPKYQKGDEIGYFFIINSQAKLLEYISTNLTAEPLNFSANTIRIAFKDHNPQKAQAVLNKIDTVYLSYSNEQKNLANRQKIDWLISELAVLEKRMESHENYFEDFTLKNKTSNLDEDLRNTIIAMNAVDSQRYNYTKRITEVSSIISGLATNDQIQAIGTTQFLSKSALDRLHEFQQLQRELSRLKLSHTPNTYRYQQKQQEIEAARALALEELNSLKKEWATKLQELNGKKSSLEREFALLPDKNTEFSKNERFYKLYEELYLTLMQSKSELEIAHAGSTPDFKILSPASFPQIPISPKKFMIMGVGVVASIVLNFLFIGILYLLNNKITNIQELERVTGAPVLGTIPFSKNINGGLHVLNHPKSMVSEAIRSLRTNLDFFQSSEPRKVIAISSTVSGEGKSFIAMNLGGVIALSKKKVILLDLDMRKTKVSTPAESLDETKGVSTILIRRNSWQECVTRTSMENFDFINAGPHPPNPSELLLNGDFTRMIEELKLHYDFIILDTPPVGLVTDGIMAMKKADISVYVFRANYSKKEFLSNLHRLVSINKIKNITSVLNALPSSTNTYGYGYYEESGSSGKLKSFFKS